MNYTKSYQVKSLKANGVNMNQVSEKLAYSLEKLKLLQDSGIIAVQSKMLERTDRERSSMALSKK